MRIVQHATAQEFLAATQQLRGAMPVETNLAGSVATMVAAGGRRFETMMWLTIEATSVVGLALRTAPHNLVVSPMPPVAARILGTALRELDPEVPGVSGPPDVVAEVVAGLGAGDRAVVHMAELVRVLSTLVPPAHPVPGAPRAVVPADLELVADWMVAFAAEAGLHVQPPRAGVLEDLRRREPGSMLLWEVDGTAVSLGGRSRLVPTPGGTVGRIGPIYTPAPYRGRGLASAITHALATELQRTCDIVMLFTDAANPASNSIYAQLGFEVVAEVVDVRLER